MKLSKRKKTHYHSGDMKIIQIGKSRMGKREKNPLYKDRGVAK